MSDLPLPDDPPSIMTWGPGKHSRTPEWRLIRYAYGSKEVYIHQVDFDEWAHLAAPAVSDLEPVLRRTIPPSL